MSTVAAGPPTARSNLEVLTADQCRELLAGVTVGRVAVTVGALPSVVPVHFTVEGDDVIFTNPWNDSLDATLSGTVIALQADSLDPAEGWTVVVTGIATDVSPPGEAPNGWLRLPTDVISGRRLVRRSILVGGSVPLTVGGPAGPHASTAIPPDDCLRLLAECEVGRIVVLGGEAPVVFPVNYALDEKTVVFRTASQTLLARRGDGLVAFQVDRQPSAGRDGWAVQLLGVAEMVDDTDGPLREHLDGLGIYPWAGPDRDRYVCIRPLTVSGAWIPAGTSR